MTRFFLVSGAILGLIGVAAGSFGAHGLKSLLDANGQAANWETAVRYCLFHAIAMLVVAISAALTQSAATRGFLAASGWTFLIGTLIFSGVLAALALSGVKILGAIVPIGGVLLLVGWACLAAAGCTWTPGE